MAILFVASEGFELQPLAARLTGLRSLKWPLDYAMEGVWEGKRYLLTANGAGPKLAAHCVEVALRATSMAELSSSKLEAVVSTGMCGALDPSFTLGEIVVADRLLVPDSPDSFEPALPDCEKPHRTGSVLSLDSVAGTREEKGKLRMAGACAVEMEAAGVARRALNASLPFCCVKAVLDTADEEFVMDFNELRTIDGRFARGKIIVHALTHPNTIPRLIRLRRRSKQAASALGVFLASCRFQFSNVRPEPEPTGP